MKYRIARRAAADIEGHCARIATFNRDAADQLDERIHHEIELLAQFPGMGHGRPDVSDPRYLFWAVGKHVIVYRVEGKELLVVRVLYGARDFGKLFKQRGQADGNAHEAD